MYISIGFKRRKLFVLIAHTIYAQDIAQRPKYVKRCSRYIYGMYKQIHTSMLADPAAHMKLVVHNA